LLPIIVYFFWYVLIAINNHYQYQRIFSNPVSIQKEWKKQLKQGGCSQTKPHKEIIQVIAKSSHSLIPVEIYDRTLEYGPRMGLMTV
jgi:hypothetical protein